jgi:hypothetical protein
LIDAHIYGGNELDVGSGIFFDSVGEPIIVAYSASTNLFELEQPEVDLTLAKFDAVYNLEWMKFYGGPGNESGNDILTTSDGGYVVAGSATSITGDLAGLYDTTIIGAENRKEDIWLVKFDAAGTIVWQKVYGMEDEEIPFSIFPTENGGHLVYADKGDAWIFSIDSNGTKEWEFSIGGSYAGGHGTIIRSHSGSHIVTSAAVLGGYHNTMLLEVDSTGTLIRQKLIGGSMHESGGDIIALSNGGYALLTVTTSNDGDVPFNHGSYDLWLVELDDTLGIVRSKTFGGSGADNTAGGVYETPNGFILCGAAYSTNGDVTTNLGEYDVWVITLDSAWNIVKQSSYGGNGGDQPEAFSRLTNDVYVFGGTTRSSDLPNYVNRGTGDGYIGVITTTTQHVRSRPAASLHEIAYRITEGRLVIDVPTGYEGGKVVLCDVTGRMLIEAGTLNAGTVDLNVADLSSGMYMLRLTHGTNRPLAEKIILSR